MAAQRRRRSQADRAAGPGTAPICLEVPLVPSAGPLPDSAVRPPSRLDARNADRFCSCRWCWWVFGSRRRIFGRSSWLAGIVAFFSATQDIVLDAYRRELLPDLELGTRQCGSRSDLPNRGTDSRVARVGVVRPPRLAVGHHDRRDVHVGRDRLDASIPEAVAKPRAPRRYVRRSSNRSVNSLPSRPAIRAARARVHVLLQARRQHGDRVVDAVLSRSGIQPTEIGLIAKNAASVARDHRRFGRRRSDGSIGINRALWIFGCRAASADLRLCGVVGNAGPNPWALAIVIALEYLGVGLGTAAFVAFIARETTPALAATQFALFHRADCIAAHAGQCDDGFSGGGRRRTRRPAMVWRLHENVGRDRRLPEDGSWLDALLLSVRDMCCPRHVDAAMGRAVHAPEQPLDLTHYGCQRYLRSAIRPEELNTIAFLFESGLLTDVVRRNASGNEMPPDALTTRCHGMRVPLGSWLSTCPTRRAPPGNPASSCDLTIGRDATLRNQCDDLPDLLGDRGFFRSSACSTFAMIRSRWRRIIFVTVATSSGVELADSSPHIAGLERRARADDMS